MVILDFKKQRDIHSIKDIEEILVCNNLWSSSGGIFFFLSIQFSAPHCDCISVFPLFFSPDPNMFSHVFTAFSKNVQFELQKLMLC